MARFRTAFYKLLPSWLRKEGEDSEKVVYSLSLLIDASLERLRQGLVARFPEYTEAPDALPKLGRDRGITRGPNETEASYAARLIPYRYPQGHRVRGNAFEMCRQIKAYLASVGTVRVRTVDQRGNWYTVDYDGTESYQWDVGDWDWDGAADSPAWGRFWVIIYTDLLGDVSDIGDIGDPDLWETGEIGNANAYIGLASLVTVHGTAVQQLMKSWKPAGTLPQFVILATDPDSFDPGVTLETDGTWDDPVNRLSTASYVEYAL